VKEMFVGLTIVCAKMQQRYVCTAKSRVSIETIL
jgi:hypothetical protein